VYLTGVYLMGVYLINVHLTGVQLMGVHLIDAYFMDVYMFPNDVWPDYSHGRARRERKLCLGNGQSLQTGSIDCSLLHHAEQGYRVLRPWTC
jgi:hypothetical protein